MPNRRFAARVILVSLFLLFASVGPAAQREAQAACYYPVGYHIEYWRLIACHGEGCVPQRQIVGEVWVNCDGTASSWGYTTCGGNTGCTSTLIECEPVCDW